MAEMRSPRDTENQEKVARILEKEWGCYMHLSFGKWAGVNYEASWDHAHEDVFAHVEIRIRYCSSFDYDRITMLGYDKYQSMMKHQKDHGYPVRFVIQFNSNSDLFWIPLGEIYDASEIRHGGREPRAGAPHDKGAMLYLPLAAMHHIPPARRSKTA